jgi:hypothetical protein
MLYIYIFGSAFVDPKDEYSFNKKTKKSPQRSALSMDWRNCTRTLALMGSSLPAKSLGDLMIQNIANKQINNNK